MKASIAKLSIDTQTIYDFLAKMEVGQSATYSSLSAIIGRDVQGDARSCLDSARRKLLNENRIVIGTVTGIGVKRLDDSAIIGEALRSTGKIKRAARKGLKTLASVRKFDDLSPDERNKHNTQVATLGAIALFSGVPGQRKIERAVADSSARIPLAKTLALFGPKG